MAYQAKAHPGFSSKRLGIFLLLRPGWNVCLSQGRTQCEISRYQVMPLGGGGEGSNVREKGIVPKDTKQYP